MLNDRQERIKNRIEEDDFLGYLDTLIEGDNFIDSPASLGIAKKAVSDNSIVNLTDYQIETLIKYGIDIEGNYISECNVCQTELPWCEMSYGAYIGMCSKCQQTTSKDD